MNAIKPTGEVISDHLLDPPFFHLVRIFVFAAKGISYTLVGP